MEPEIPMTDPTVFEDESVKNVIRLVSGGKSEIVNDTFGLVAGR